MHLKIPPDRYTHRKYQGEERKRGAVGKRKYMWGKFRKTVVVTKNENTQKPYNGALFLAIFAEYNTNPTQTQCVHNQRLEVTRSIDFPLSSEV